MVDDEGGPQGRTEGLTISRSHRGRVPRGLPTHMTEASDIDELLFVNRGVAMGADAMKRIINRLLAFIGGQGRRSEGFTREVSW